MLKLKLPEWTKKILTSVITASALLTWCGWWWGWYEWTKVNTTNNNQDNNFWYKKEKLIWQIQAWPVKWAEVIIEWPNGEELYRTETNTTGHYVVDKEKFEKS